MKKKWILSTCFIILALIGLTLFYTYFYSQNYYKYVPTVTYENQVDVTKHEFFSPDYEFLAGEYKLEVSYQSDEKFSLSVGFGSIDDFSALAEVELLPGNHTEEINFSVLPDLEMYKFRVKFVGEEKDNIFIENYKFLLNGDVVAYGENENFLSEDDVYCNNVLLDQYTKIASCSFENMPDQHQEAIINNYGDNIFIEVSGFDSYGEKVVVQDLTEFGSGYNSIYDLEGQNIILDIYEKVDGNYSYEIYSDNDKMFQQIECFFIFIAVFLIILQIALIVEIAFLKHDSKKLMRTFSFFTVILFGISITACLAKMPGVISSTGLCFCIIFLINQFFFIKNESVYYRLEQNGVQNVKDICAGIAALILSLLLFRGMLTSKENSILWIFNSQNKANLKDYLLVTLLCFILFLLFRCVLDRWKFGDVISSSHGKLILYSCFILVQIALLKEHISWTNDIAWYGQIGLIVMCGALFFWSIQNERNLETPKFIYILYILTVGLTFIATKVTNLYILDDTTEYNVHHAGAYLAPLYYVANNKPFVGGETDLYGHYALFYKIPMMIFGQNSQVIGILMGILGGLIAVLFIGIIQRLIHSNTIKILMILALINIAGGFAKVVYWQTFPHRLIFPTVIMYLAVLLKDKKITEKYSLIGYLICMLSIIWSNESGIVCAISWAAYIVYKKNIDKEKCIKGIIINGFREVVIVAVEVLGAFGIVELYNYVAGGFDANALLGIKTFLGILLNPSYMVYFHMTLLEWGNKDWISIFILFVGIVLFSVSKLGFLKKSRAKSDYAVYFMIAVMGLGMFTFFMNRTAAGYNIAFIMIILCFGILMDRLKYLLSKENIEKIKAKGISHIEGIHMIVFVASCFVFLNVMMNTQDALDAIIDNRMNGESNNYDAYCEELVNFQNHVPANAYAYGDGLNVIYMNLGWTFPADDTDSKYVVTNREPEDYYVKIQDVYMCDYRYTVYYNTKYND